MFPGVNHWTLNFEFHFKDSTDSRKFLGSRIIGRFGRWGRSPKICTQNLSVRFYRFIYTMVEKDIAFYQKLLEFAC